MQQTDGPSELRLGDRYQINLHQKLADIGGCEAYAAQRQGGGGSCVALAPTSPSPRLLDIVAFRHESVMPLDAIEYHLGAQWLICAHSPGASLEDGFPSWSENHIIEGAIRPIASALIALQAADMTCRAIRPDNLYLGGNGQRLVLGPLGTAPPAANQPIVFESLSSAVCQPHARGPGTHACDIFSLGVLVLSLCMGRVPLDGMTDEEILDRRLRFGSAVAYIGDFRVPDGLESAIRAMLSDDAETRPSAHDLVSMASDKLFFSRPAIPARRPLRIGGVEVWTPRALAWHGAQNQGEFAQLLQQQVVAQWLRRDARQIGMAAAVEQVGGTSFALERKSVDSVGLNTLHVFMILDPEAPLFWGNRWFWPDAVPAMLAQTATLGPQRQHEERDVCAIASFVVDNAEFFESAAISDRLRAQTAAIRALVRKSDARGTEAIRRLPYDGNLYQICLSPKCREDRLCQAGGVLEWVNREAGGEDLTTERIEQGGFLDADMRLFLASQFMHLRIGGGMVTGSGLPVWNQDIVMLAAVQRKLRDGKVVALTKKVFPLLKEELRHWRSRTARHRRRAELKDAAEGGDLTRLLQAAEDPQALRTDHQLALRAEEEIARLVHDLDPDPALRAKNARLARNAGEFISLIAGIGVAMASVWFEFCQ